MNYANEPSASSPQRQPCPAVTVCAAFATGIVADRVLDGTLWMWLILAALLWTFWLVMFLRRQSVFAAVALLLCSSALGAAHHHAFWSLGEADDISLFADDERRLILLSGIIRDEPERIPAPPVNSMSVFPPQERTIGKLQCREIATDRGPVTVTGLIRFEVSGTAPPLTVGDEVRILGWISKPTSLRNPGGFDYSRYLRSRRIRAIVSTDHPESIEVVASPSPIVSPGRLRSRLRQTYRELFRKTLSPEAVPVAQSLFLGDRTSLPYDVQQAFRVTGSMHVLAISGLHLGILALLIWCVARLLKVSSANTALILLVVVWSYAFLTNGQASVIRACILATVFAGSLWKGKQANSFNSWGLSALVVLTRNPLDLFDVGAQLSFLAVAGILWCSPLTSRLLEPSDPLFARFDRNTTHSVPWRNILRLVLAGYLISIVVWTVTTPLILGTFHVISPVGLLLGTPLNPLVVVTLWAGYLLMWLGLLLPFTAVVFGTVLNWGIMGLLSIVEGASQVTAGHFFAHGPGLCWQLVFYGLLIQCIWSPITTIKRRWCGYAGGLWLIAGLTTGLWTQHDANLRCTFLSVGHGCAILIELPNGGRVLYDAGSLHDGRRAAHAVQSALWQASHPRLDLVLLSHTDVDHYNALPEIFRTTPVGTLACPRAFVDFSQAGVEDLCRVARELGIPIRFLERGDRLQIDPKVAIDVIHPDGQTNYASDNESSLVLAIEYAGRKILLTGDVADEGLGDLLATSPQRCDVMLSPHHGSPAANPPGLATWAQPRWVVVSHGHSKILQQLSEVYGPQTEIVSTFHHGAVVVEIDRHGEIAVNRTLNPSPEQR
ncbi:MAG: ComEC/Rec2 family competence protein [Planctomycetota bacterium]|nr:ComEC/Rec2 family competence protein [Planctomycetota bacterium]MDA1214188.1 ComEC/Rec2 family competence protein [Planctomycetota bacterium]